MLIITSLILTLALEFAESCSTEDDGSFKQIIHYYRGQCKCREYVNVYATCYYSSCTTFPRHYRTQLKCFKLQETTIRKISPGDLGNLTHLTGLFLDENKELVRIVPGTFQDMKNLVTLSISFNRKLTRLDENVFKGLYNLETLTLARDGFSDFKDFTPSLKAEHMPKLKTINLNALNCPRLNKDDFINLNGSTVTNLFFDDTQVRIIHPDALTTLTNLQNLSLSETPLTNENLIGMLEKIKNNNIPLRSLNLKGWGFKMTAPKNLFNAIANITIKELILNRNQFQLIDENTFPEMPNIENLFLEQSMVGDVRENAFSNFPKLKQLYLKQNNLVSIPDGVLLPTLQLLDISGNTRQDTSYFSVEEDNFINMPSLTVLDLSNNNLRKVYNHTFSGLTNLKTLNLHHCNVVVISDNSFVELISLEYLDLGRNRFPQRTFSKDTFKGLENLKYLSLENCKIDGFPSKDLFVYLTSLETLNLKQNSLMEITPDIVTSLKTLKVLNVDENGINMWHNRLFKDTNMENLTASRNIFTYLTIAMLADISELKMVDVSKNPFQCDCENLIQPFASLTQSKINYVLTTLDQKSTYCLIPPESENITIVTYYQRYHKSCGRDSIAKLMSYLIPSLVCAVLILTSVILSYVYRWHIRYWIFLTKLAVSKRTQFRKKISVQGPTKYLYDAFVSYSSEDRNFVIRLVSMLENYEPFLKLCVYERDFEIGTIISESVLESLSRSRKTLLVISNSYIKSQWCTWEAQVAENHRLFFENEHGQCVNDSLIMIKLGNISNNSISPMLRYLMKTRIYLQWDPADGRQKQFWEKLRNALAPSINSKDEKTVDIK